MAPIPQRWLGQGGIFTGTVTIKGGLYVGVRGSITEVSTW